MDIKKRAQKKLAERRNLEAQAKADHEGQMFDRFTLWLNREFGIGPGDLEKSGVRANFLPGRNGSRNRMVIFGECPYCRKQVESEDIYDWADLGEMLDEFRPAHIHFGECPATSIQPSAEDRIVSALERIADAIESGDAILLSGATKRPYDGPAWQDLAGSTDGNLDVKDA